MKIYKVKVNGKVYEVELESVSESSAKIEVPAVLAAPAAPVAASAGSTEVTSPRLGASPWA